MRFFHHRVALLSACVPVAVAISGAVNHRLRAPRGGAGRRPGAVAGRARQGARPGWRLPRLSQPEDNGAIDQSLMLSGHPSSLKITSPDKVTGPWVIGTNDMLTAWSGPWGISYAANITPDPDTGLKAGAWS